MGEAQENHRDGSTVWENCLYKLMTNEGILFIKKFTNINQRFKYKTILVRKYQKHPVELYLLVATVVQ